MDQNEYKFAKSIVTLDRRISEAMQYVYDNFGVNSVYDEDEHRIDLSVTNVDEGLQLLAAKEYIDNILGEDSITTNI